MPYTQIEWEAKKITDEYTKELFDVPTPVLIMDMQEYSMKLIEKLGTLLKTNGFSPTHHGVEQTLVYNIGRKIFLEYCEDRVKAIRS